MFLINLFASQPAIICSKLTIETLEICSKLTITTLERRQCRRSGILLLALNIFHTLFCFDSTPCFNSEFSMSLTKEKQWRVLSKRQMKQKKLCGALHDLVTFTQFKKREKQSWRSVTFSNA